MGAVYTIFTDGGARGNPGPAGIGGLVLRNGKLVHRFSRYIGRQTNNQAEYKALIKALSWLRENAPFGAKVILKVDSQLVARQLAGEFKVKNFQISELVRQALLILSKGGFRWQIKSIPRALNRQADALVNQALDKHLGADS